MSHEFLDPEKTRQSSESQQAPSNPKVDPEAQMKWLEYLAHPERNANQGILLNPYPTTEGIGREKEDNLSAEAQIKMKGHPRQLKSNKEKTQQKDPNDHHEKEKWRITRYTSPGHQGGYQHIFDEEGKLIILMPVHGPHTFHITTSPKNYDDKGDGVYVGVGEIKQVDIHDVFSGLYMFYHSRPELEHPFVDHIYKYNKEDGYDYVQYRSIKRVNQSHKDFFNKGGWMMLAVAAIPFAVEAIPFIIQSSPQLITKIPRPLLIKALKKVGKPFLIKTSENSIDALISYIFTGDVDLVSIGLNYVPGMGKTKKAELLYKGLLLLIDASVDYNMKKQEIEVIAKEKPVGEATIDLFASVLGKAANINIDKEFSSEIAKLFLRIYPNVLLAGSSNSIKNEINERNDKNTE